MRGITVGYMLRVLVATVLAGAGAAGFFVAADITPQVMRFAHFPEVFMVAGGLLYLVNARVFFRARRT